MDRPRVVEPYANVEQMIRIWLICASKGVGQAAGRIARGHATDEDRAMIARHLAGKMQVARWEVTRLDVQPVRDDSSHNARKRQG